MGSMMGSMARDVADVAADVSANVSDVAPSDQASKGSGRPRLF